MGYFEPGRTGYGMILVLVGVILGLGVVDFGVWVLGLGRNSLGVRRGVLFFWGRWVELGH